MGGRALDLGGRRQRSVLALLVVARGDTVPSGRFVDALWGAQASSNTVGALHAYVSHLRRQLEPGRAARSRGTVIVREGPGYALRVERESVDAWRFERLVEHSSAVTEPSRAATVLSEALALWRGPAFADYAATPWAEAEATRLTALRAVARERLLAARLSSGDSAVLIPELEALVTEEPLREERWRLLVLALYRAHRQGEALAALEEVQRLQPEFDNPAWWPWRSFRAQALAGLGRHPEAVALVEDELVAARWWGSSPVVGRTLRVLGELRGADGVATLREALAVLAQTTTHLEYARAAHALARVVPAAEAVPLLRQAYGIAQHCGATGLCRSIATDLDSAGAPRAAEADATVTLTATERRVAGMFPDGADERDIAEALFLSPRSVQATLQSVRDRLAVTSRVELAAALAAAR